jgi:hypothetical protein
VGWGALLLVLILILIARPLGIFLSTWMTSLVGKERLFLTWMAPRGIVAASVASVFAFDLAEIGHEGADLLVPVIFLVIVGTVIFYGLTAGPVARRLGLSEQNPQGVLIIGAHSFARGIAGELKNLGFRALLLDSNFSHITESLLEGLEAFHGNALSEETLEELDLGGIGRLMALTSNDEVNALAVLHFPDVFGRSQVYQLPTAAGNAQFAPSHLRGRVLFGSNATFDFFESQMEMGATLKVTSLSNQFTYNDFLSDNGSGAIPLFLVTDGGRLIIYTTDNQPSPKPGHTLVSFLPANGNNG